MGEVRVSIRLQGITKRGDLSARGAGNFEALVDTGASKTIVSEAVAQRVGIRRLGYTGGVAGVTGTTQVDVGMALALTPRCQPEALLVGISDEVTRRAGVDVILGHDYMQAVKMAVTPHNGRATCPTPHKRRRAGRAA